MKEFNLAKFKECLKKNPSILVLLACLMFSLYLLFLYSFLYDNDRTSESQDIIESVDEDSWELRDFEFSSLKEPLLLNDKFQLYDDEYENFNNEQEYTYKTGMVISGKIINPNGQEFDLKGYEKFNLIYQCNTLSVLYSSKQSKQFLIASTFCDPNSLTPNQWYGVDSFIDFEKGTNREIQFIVIPSEYFHDYFEVSLDSKPMGSTIPFEVMGNIYEPEYLSSIGSLEAIDIESNSKIFLIEDKDNLKFLSFSPEGFPVSLAYISPFQRSPFQSPGNDIETPITLLNNEKINFSYSAYDPINCTYMPIDNEDRNTFEKIGTAFDGSNIYVKKDKNDQYRKNIYSNLYLSEKSYLTNDIKEDDEQPYNYEMFADSYPVIYWLSPFNKMLRFNRYDLIYESENCIFQ